jgi:hypothetical protein
MKELVRRASVLGIAILIGAACGDEPASATSILVTFETPSGSFIARIVDPVSIDRAREALDEGGSAGIPNGRILEGDGGVNSGHNWHLEDVELVDVTIEACDGTADFVDENLDVYLDLGNYCPWSAVVVAVERE